MKKIALLIISIIFTIAILAGCELNHQHFFGEWTVVKEATCTDEGKRTRTCSCGEIVEEIIPASHNEVIIPAVPATCTNGGLQESKKCADCGKVLEGRGIIAPTGHNWVENYIVPPTCTESGSTYGMFCTNCGESKGNQRVHPPLGHTEVITKNKIPATCTETGLTEERQCTVCGEITNEQMVIPITHDYEYFTKTDENGNIITVAICKNDECGSIAKYASGLYDAEGKLLASWDELVNTYGVDIEKDYEYIAFVDWKKESNHIDYILKNNEDLKSASTLIIGDAVTKIGDLALYYCDSLTTIIITDWVTSIGTKAFSGCKSLESIQIPDSVTTVGDDAFSGCKSLQSVKLSNNLTTISSRMFEGCVSLTDIQIPSGVININPYAFYCCSSVTKIALSDSVEVIDLNAFRGCVSVKNIAVDGNNGNYESIDGNLYDKNEKILLIYAAGKDDTEFTVPKGVKGIGSGAFDLCNKLVKIKLPDSLISIGSMAFKDCNSITEITIPGSVTSIGAAAFSYCKSLKDIYFEGTTEEWEAINYTRSYLSNNIVVHFDGKKQFMIHGFAGYFGSSGAAGWRYEVIVEDIRIFIEKNYYDTISYVDNLEIEYTSYVDSYGPNQDERKIILDQIKANKGWYIIEGISVSDNYIGLNKIAICEIDGVYYFLTIIDNENGTSTLIDKIHCASIG